jgi:hypothetical protein
LTVVLRPFPLSAFRPTLIPLLARLRQPDKGRFIFQPFNPLRAGLKVETQRPFHRNPLTAKRLIVKNLTQPPLRKIPIKAGNLANPIRIALLPIANLIPLIAQAAPHFHEKFGGVNKLHLPLTPR